MYENKYSFYKLSNILFIKFEYGMPLFTKNSNPTGSTKKKDNNCICERSLQLRYNYRY